MGMNVGPRPLLDYELRAMEVLHPEAADLARILRMITHDLDVLSHLSASDPMFCRCEESIREAILQLRKFIT